MQRNCPFLLLLMLLALSGQIEVRHFPVVVSEIHYHPVLDPHSPPGDIIDPGEFIELYNRGDESVDLSGWTLGGGILFQFPQGTVLLPHTYLVVAHHMEYFLSIHPEVERVVGDFEGNLSNARDRVSLRAANGELVDRVAYDDDDPWPENPDGLGPSLERTNYVADGEQQWVWRSSIPLGGTPGAPNSTYEEQETRVLIAQGDLWRYFKGTREPAASLGAWADPDFNDNAWPEGPSGFGYGDGDDATVLDDMEDNYTTVYIRKAFTLQDPASFASLALTVAYDDAFVAYLNGIEIGRSQSAGGTPGQVLPHDATAAGSHEVDESSAVIDLTATALLRSGRNVLALQALNRSIGSSDLSLIPTLIATERSPGSMVEPPHDLEINEVYRGSTAAESFIEIYYEGAEPADLSDFLLVTDPAGRGGYRFPQGTVMQPGSFLLVRGDSLPFALYDIAQWFGLVTPDGRFIDGVQSWARPPGTAWGRYPDGRGRFFVLDSPTPGQPNDYTSRSDVVINEVRYHPPVGADTEEFIELYNRSDGFVDLTGWTIRKAVSYTFPENQTLPARSFLVVARNPQALRARYDLSGVLLLGPWTGGLANSEEKIELYDALGNRVDVVHYADDGTWPGSTETEGPDGFGPSIELVNPGIENNHGSAWRASVGPGTPGAQNSTYDPDPPPVIRSLSHEPAQPLPHQEVTVRARVSDERGIALVRLYWREDGPGTFSRLTMSDPDNDGYFEATIPPHPAGTIVQFYVRADDTSANRRTYPHDAPARVMLYQVDDAPYPGGVPLYRIVMREADFRELTTRDVMSDVLLDGTFIRGRDIYYNVGVRYRGEHSRQYWRKSFRIQFSHDRRFEDIKRLNLNAQDTHLAHLAADFMRRADVPTFQTRIVAFTANNNFDNAYGGIYERVEAVDRDFLRRAFPRDDEGNLYRGRDLGGSREADLSYRGEDPASYQEIYEKKTNELENDYSDIIALTDAFANTPDEEFLSVISDLIDVDEWLRFFAAQMVASNQDGTIATSAGEDYFLYHRQSDGRFVIIPWDLNETFFDPGDGLFRMQSNAVQRLVRHPQLVRSYLLYVKSFLEGPFSEEAMSPHIEALRSYYSAADLDAVTRFLPQQRAAIESGFPDRLTVGLSANYLIRSGDTWRFFRGTEEPSGGTTAWTRLTFDDSSWEEGPGGFGYGDGDDRTILSDMRGNYTTVYIRRRFALSDPLALRSLTLSVRYDDGFVAYLNGTEVARRNVSGRVRFDERATADHEVGPPRVIDLSDQRGLLRQGDNVLALVGVNVSINSSDLSLDPELIAGGSAGGCGSRLFPAGALTLGGTAPTPETAEVHVNGEQASYDVLTGRWYFDTPGQPGEQQFLIEALDESGKALAEVRATVLQSGAGSTVPGGSVSGSWSSASNPYLVQGTVTVPAGETLVIGAGTHVLFEAGSALVVRGTLRAEGTETNPVVLEPAECNGPWGGVLFRPGAVGNLKDCEILNAASRSAGEQENAAILLDAGSQATLTRCMVKDNPSWGVVAVGPDSVALLQDCVLSGSEGGVAARGASAQLAGCTIQNLLGTEPAILIAGSSLPQSQVRSCTLLSGPGDGIQVIDSDCRIEGCTISGMVDSGISLEGTGSPDVVRTILSECEDGLKASDSVTALLDRCTISANLEGIDCRGSAALTVESSIVWGNGIGIWNEPDTSLTIRYSDIQGGWPGTANGDFDPLFVDPASGDFHLRSGSPAIGAGRNGVDMGALPAGGPPVARFLRGDGNTDGGTDISDVVNLLLYLFAGGRLSCLDAADANDDGALNVADAVSILSYLFAEGDPLPDPIESCGPDPTGDTLSCERFTPCGWEP